MRQKYFGLTSGELAICVGIGFAMAAAVFFMASPFVVVLAAWLLGVSMALITLVDQRQFRIPDVLSLPMLPVGLAVSYVLDASALAHNAFAALLGGGFLYGLNLAYRRLRGVDGLGMGDVKLIAVAGAWTGLTGLPLVMLLASCGALTSLMLQKLFGLQRHHTWRTAIPFGSYLAPSIAAVWLLQSIR